jgi:hypothetical protein
VKTLTTIALAAAIAALSGCVVAPARGYYQNRDPSYDRGYQSRDGHYYRHERDRRWRDGDHAGGTDARD